MRPLLAFLICLFISTTTFAYPATTPERQVYDLAHCFGNDRLRTAQLNGQLNTFARTNEGARIIVLCLQRTEGETVEAYAQATLRTVPSQNFITLLALAREPDAEGHSGAIVTNSGATARLGNTERTRILRLVVQQKIAGDYPHALEYGADALVNALGTVEPEPTIVNTTLAEPAPTPSTATQASPPQPAQDEGVPVGLIIAIIFVAVLLVFCMIYFPEYNLITSLLELLAQLISAAFSSKD